MKRLNELHILGIIRDKRLTSIREIRQSDIGMLIGIKDESILKIKNKYDLGWNKIKIFFHYMPSTYLLHIHFVHIEKCNHKSSVEQCIAFDDVIKNISINENYYHGDMNVLVHI
jgi:hypothetical protein